MALWQLNLSHAAMLVSTEQQRCKGFGFRCGHRQGHSRALNLIVHVCMSLSLSLFSVDVTKKTDKVPRGKTIEVEKQNSTFQMDSDTTR